MGFVGWLVQANIILSTFSTVGIKTKLCDLLFFFAKSTEKHNAKKTGEKE